MTLKSVRARRAARQWVVAGLLFAVTAGVLIGIVVWRLNRTPAPDALLCPSAGPIGHVAVLVDTTDPLTFTQERAFDGFLETIVSGKRIREGELLSVFVLGENFKEGADAIFERCHPGDGHDKNPLKDNPDLWKKRYQEEFAAPVKDLKKHLLATKAAERSPIIEMIQLVGLAFERHGVQGPKRLLIVSDMLHNTGEYSMYRGRPDFDAFRLRPEYPRMRAKLTGVDVEIFLLLHRPDLQTRTLTKFWEEYFKDADATLQRVNPMPG